MALTDLTFKLWTDAGQTTAFGGTLQVNHETDLSDNSQDFVYYFGSNETAGTRTLETVTSPGVNQITVTPTDGLADWAVATAYILGDTIEPTTPDTYAYECTTAGTSHASTEPVWSGMGGIGSTIVDNTAVWTKISKRHEVTEVKLATTLLGLDSATAGALVNLGTSIDADAANQVELHIRITNAVTTVGDTTGFPEITLDIVNVQETT